MKNRAAVSALLFAAGAMVGLGGGCAGLRWSGHHRHEDLGPGDRIRENTGLAPDYGLEAGGAPGKTLEVAASTRPAKVRPESLLRELGPDEDTLYYSDLGPAAIDVSGYPLQQRENYRLFERACSQCHTAARAINAPTVSRAFWQFYMSGMSTRSRVRTGAVAPITREESEAIMDFLEYDARERKVRRADDFDALTEALKERHQRVIDERLRRLGEKLPP